MSYAPRSYPEIVRDLLTTLTGGTPYQRLNLMVGKLNRAMQRNPLLTEADHLSRRPQPDADQAYGWWTDDAGRVGGAFLQCGLLGANAAEAVRANADDLRAQTDDEGLVDLVVGGPLVEPAGERRG